MIFRTLLLCFLLAIQGASIASDNAPVDSYLGRILVRIPAGFDGPDRSFPNKASELHVYFSRKESQPTLLQLTQLRTAEARPDLDEKMRQEAAENFLTGFLQTFSKNVQKWKRSSVEKVRLGQHPAVRATWTGNYHGLPTKGTMYFLVFGKESYCIHTFGRADLPNPLLESSIRAIEALQVAR